MYHPNDEDTAPVKGAMIRSQIHNVGYSDYQVSKQDVPESRSTI